MSNLKRTLDHLKSKGLLGYLRYKLDKKRQHRSQHENALRFYAQFLQPGDLCFDVGANMGNRTRLFLDLGAKVVCVEPQEDCVRTLERSFKGRPVSVVQSGLDERPGVVTMMISSANTISTMSPRWIENAGRTGRFGAVSWERKIQVPVTTLDEIIRRHGRPRFIKIDVEGFESQVLRGLSQPVECLSFEFVGEDFKAMEACVEHLLTLGKPKFNYSLGESLVLASPRWLEPGSLLAEVETLRGPLPWGDIYAVFEN